MSVRGICWVAGSLLSLQQTPMQASPWDIFLTLNVTLMLFFSLPSKEGDSRASPKSERSESTRVTPLPPNKLNIYDVFLCTLPKDCMLPREPNIGFQIFGDQILRILLSSSMRKFLQRVYSNLNLKLLVLTTLMISIRFLLRDSRDWVQISSCLSINRSGGSESTGTLPERIETAFHMQLDLIVSPPSFSSLQGLTPPTTTNSASLIQFLTSSIEMVRVLMIFWYQFKTFSYIWDLFEPLALKAPTKLLSKRNRKQPL